MIYQFLVTLGLFQRELLFHYRLFGFKRPNKRAFCFCSPYHFTAWFLSAPACHKFCLCAINNPHYLFFSNALLNRANSSKDNVSPLLDGIISASAKLTVNQSFVWSSFP